MLPRADEVVQTEFVVGYSEDLIQMPAKPMVPLALIVEYSAIYSIHFSFGNNSR